jgi:diaminopimelate decarboxylase
MNTPYFIIHKNEFDNNVALLNKAIQKHWKNSLVGYSVKSNGMPWVLKYMKEQGFYAEVVSDDEYSLAKACGYPVNRIIYNGIAKDETSFKEAVAGGAIVNIDSWRELRWVQEIPDSIEKRIGLRVNFDLEKMCPGQTASGKEGSRFGISYENGDLKNAIISLNQIPNCHIIGLHLHNSIPSRSLDAYCAISRKACEITRVLNLQLEYVDIGGGFFGGLENRPNYLNYFAVISDALSEFFDKDKTILIVEPGQSILATAITYVTSIVDVKKTIYNRFVVTDGGRTQIDPMFRKNSHFYEIVADDYKNRSSVEKQVIVGFTCVEGDRLFTLLNEPELKEGDKIFYHKIGAYTYTSASQFIKFLPSIYVEDENGVHEVCKKWEAIDFINKQC